MGDGLAIETNLRMKNRKLELATITVIAADVGQLSDELYYSTPQRRLGVTAIS